MILGTAAGELATGTNATFFFVGSGARGVESILSEPRVGVPGIFNLVVIGLARFDTSLGGGPPDLINLGLIVGS